MVFERGAGAIEPLAEGGDARVLFGSAQRHQHPLVLGTSSVHTERAALERSLRRIHSIGAELRREGKV